MYSKVGSLITGSSTILCILYSLSLLYSEDSLYIRLPQSPIAAIAMPTMVALLMMLVGTASGLRIPVTRRVVVGTTLAVHANHSRMIPPITCLACSSAFPMPHMLVEPFPCLTCSSASPTPHVSQNSGRRCCSANYCLGFRRGCQVWRHGKRAASRK